MTSARLTSARVATCRLPANRKRRLDRVCRQTQSASKFRPGLSQEQRVRFFQKDLGQALQYEPTPEEIAALPKTVIDLTGRLKPPTPPDGKQADSKAAPIREWNVRQAPPGLCPVCWWRWSRALRIGYCVCSGDVKLTLVHQSQTHELRTEIGGDDNPAT